MRNPKQYKFKAPLIFQHHQMFRRSLAVAADAITYKRVGDQPKVAPTAIKTVSKVNGVTVATVDHLGPASSLGVYINAGSRFDTADAPGVAHLLHRSLVRVYFIDVACSW